MIKTREQLRAEADASVAEFAELIAGQEETTGIPRPPKIEVSEIALDVKPFDFGIIAEPETEVFQGEPITPPPVGCPPDGIPITVSFSGIIADCACLGRGEIVRDVSINGTFIIPSLGGGFWQGSGGVGDVTSYEHPDCSGMSTTETVTGVITAICTDGDFLLEYTFIAASSSPDVFYNAGWADFSSIPNQKDCSNQFGRSGTGTITF